MRHRFDSSPMDYALRVYRADPNDDTFSELYGAVDIIVTTLMARFMKRFKLLNPQDFEDLQQSVRIAVFQVLRKQTPPDKAIIMFVQDGEHLARILVSYVAFRFRDLYRNYRKKTPVRIVGNEIPQTWKTKYNVPLLVDIEHAIGSEELDEGDGGYHISRQAMVWEEFNPEATRLLEQVPDLMMREALKLNRYGNQQAMTFVLQQLMAGRAPSLTVLTSVWRVENPSWWPTYGKLLLRLAMVRVAAHVRRS